MKKVATLSKQNTNATITVQAIVFTKETRGGIFAYGSLAGKHRKVKKRYLKYLPNLVFLQYPPYKSFRVEEKLYMFAEDVEEKEIPIRWKRINDMLIAVEQIPNIKIPYQFGGAVVMTTKKLEEPLEGKLIIVSSKVEEK